MEIIRVIKNNNYTTVCNDIYKNQDISLKAKGLLGMILGLPPNWELSINGLAAICKEGKRAISSTLNELIEAGYIMRTPIKRNNLFNGYQYIVHEKPQSGFTYPQNVDTENVDTQNEIQLNTNKINTLIDKKYNKRFIKPKIEEIKNYCLERKNNINAERFYNYYESNGWKVGKNKMKNWKAAVRTWESSNKEKPQMESVVMKRISSHEQAKQILKNMQNGN